MGPETFAATVVRRVFQISIKSSITCDADRRSRISTSLHRPTSPHSLPSSSSGPTTQARHAASLSLLSSPAIRRNPDSSRHSSFSIVTLVFYLNAFKPVHSTTLCATTATSMTQPVQSIALSKRLAAFETALHVGRIVRTAQSRHHTMQQDSSSRGISAIRSMHTWPCRVCRRPVVVRSRFSCHSPR